MLFRITHGKISRILALLSLSVFALPMRAVAAKPNVILVITDEWRYQSTGYSGDPNVHTPSLDKFAASGVNFENAVAGCPVCSASRASLMTGQYPLTNGVYINDVPLKPKGETLGEAFARGGYRTGYVGKWHLFGSPDGYWERRLAYIPPEERMGFKYWKAIECTHDYNCSFYYDNNNPTPKIWPGYDAIAQTADACRFVQEHTRAKAPYFLVLSLAPPHFPVPFTLNSAPPKYEAMYRDRELQLRPNVPDDKKPAALRELRDYYANIAALDECFGRLLATVEATGTSEDTIVMFTSDHGDMMYSQGLQRKLVPWEESIRIPLLLRYPRKFGWSGRRSAALVNHADIMPTLLGLSGLPAPAGVQGTDYSRDIDGTGPGAPSSAFLGVPVPFIEMCAAGIAEYRGVRTTRYSYVRSIHGPWLLYDNNIDPYQMNNLCGQPEMKAIQADLDAELGRWLRKLNDEFLPAKEYLQRDGLAHYLEPKAPVGYMRSPWGDWASTLQKPIFERLSVNSAMSELSANPAAKAILERMLPDVMSNPALARAENASPSFLANRALSRGIEGKTKLQVIDEELAKLPSNSKSP